MSINYQSRVRVLDSAIHHGGKRPADPAIILWHDTAGESAMSSINYLNTTTEKKASYHYVIDRDGTMYRMTHPDIVAYHAGDSAWPHPVPATPTNQRPNDGRSVNAISLGIAFANRGDGEGLTLEQRASGLWLAKVYTARYGIKNQLNLGHYEVSPKRKSDPMPSLDMNEWRQAISDYIASPQ